MDFDYYITYLKYHFQTVKPPIYAGVGPEGEVKYEKAALIMILFVCWMYIDVDPSYTYLLRRCLKESALMWMYYLENMDIVIGTYIIELMSK